MTERASEPLTAVKGLDAVYICYWSMRDPLCQSQSLTAVRGLVKGGRKMALMTFEQARYRLGKRDRAEALTRLAEEGIVWIPLNYHRRPNILATVYDILCGALRTSWLIQRKKAQLVHARGTVPGAIAWLATRITGARFFFDADGPLSGEYADIGRWSRRSFAYRLTHWGEHRFFMAADRVAVLTDARKKELPAHNMPVEVLPCGVDLDRFCFDPSARSKLRRNYNWHGTVFLYAGKYGGWYLGESMIDFFIAARCVFRDARLVILTREDEDKFRTILRDQGLADVSQVRGVDHHEVPDWLSAADVGLSFFLPAPAVRARSPVKNGEYLACGLPVVTTKDIGDYSALIARENVGVVLQDLDKEGCRDASVRLRTLLESSGVRDRCRKVAQAHVSLEHVIAKYDRLYSGLLGAGGH